MNGLSVAGGDGQAAAPPKPRLNQAECDALMEEAKGLMVDRAAERLCPYSAAEVARLHERFVAAAEVYGALANVGSSFSLTKRERYEEATAHPQFTDLALRELKLWRDDHVHMLEDGRGTIEVDATNGPRDTFLLFVLEGIVGKGGQS